MFQVKSTPLNRDGFMRRAVIREVQLDEDSVVCIRALPASMFFAGNEDPQKTFEPANLLVQSLCDKDGALLFAGEETDRVMTVDHMALKKILDAIIDLNGLKAPVGSEAGEPEKN